MTKKQYLKLKKFPVEWGLWRMMPDEIVDVQMAMFKTHSWIVGVAAALLGYIFNKLTYYDTSKAKVSL